MGKLFMLDKNQLSLIKRIKHQLKLNRIIKNRINRGSRKSLQVIGQLQ